MRETVPHISAVEFEGDCFKVPPHSIPAEQSVLGGLMLDNQAWDQIADQCRKRISIGAIID